MERLRLSHPVGIIRGCPTGDHRPLLRRLLEIADHHSVLVTWQQVPGGGACIWSGPDDEVEVLIDPTLNDHAKVDVLAHELGHALAGRPVDVRESELLRQIIDARCERDADEHAADLTVDIEQIQRAADTVHDLGGQITAEDLADELDVPVRYARIAVERAFGHEVTRRRAAQRAETVS